MQRASRLIRQLDLPADAITNEELALAAKTPETGKDQVMQLLALRKLAASPEARKDARVRDLLTQIAERKKGIQ